jgi:hypothetical protein
MQENVPTTKIPYEKNCDRQVVRINEALPKIGVDKVLQDL